jgi:uncharacterized phage protein gp47/JayE
MAGLTLTGFVPKSLEEVRSELDEAVRQSFGESIDLSDSSVFGRLNGIIGERFALLWQLLESIYASQDPDKATGAALRAIAALTGTIFEPARSSTTTLTATGDPTTVVDEGSLVATESTGVVFRVVEDATLIPVPAWTSSTAFDLGERVTNSAKCYECVTAGTSAGSGGPSTEEDDILDGTAHWRYLGDGTAAADAEAESSDKGPIVAASGDLTVIQTPIAGWLSVINLLDAELGALDETDEALRVRREAELADIGGTNLDAVRASLLKIDGVTAVTVFMNTTDATDSDGVPPHSVEALVQGGDDQAIFDRLLASVAAGIRCHGTTSGTARDSQGTEQPVAFSRPQEIPIYVGVTLLKDADLYPLDGDQQVEDAIVAYGRLQSTGRNVVSSALSAQCFGVLGVLDVVSLFIGVAPAPASETTIAISTRQLAVYDTSRITVSSSDSVP